MLRLPERFETARLVLKRPRPDDAAAIFSTYASDAAVGHYLAWPVHRTIEDTHEFLRFSDTEWGAWPAGPYLAWSANEKTLIGSTGLAFEDRRTASTGYVIARPYWGQGYASEALAAMTRLAASASIERLYALCHPDHVASQNVLRKCGFVADDFANNACVFPNQVPSESQPALTFEFAR